VLTADQETVLRALEDVRYVLCEHVALGRRDAALTVERLLQVLNKHEIVRALDQMNRRRILRPID
jgi:hypothetical protein